MATKGSHLRKGQQFQEATTSFLTSDLFEDEDFAADDDSLFEVVREDVANLIQSEDDTIYFLPTYMKQLYDYDINERPIVWLRPHEICKHFKLPPPQFVVGGANVYDFNQGYVGDCWLISGLSHIGRRPELFQQVVPRGQGFGAEYNGSFRFRFWHNNTWTEVKIDDRLPCLTDEKGKHVFRLMGVSNPREPNEFWTSLLEKAYAKLQGGYQGIHGGQSNNSMAAITGGSGSEYEMVSVSPEILFVVIKEGLEAGYLLCLSTGSLGDNDSFGVNRHYGLVRNHCYTVTGAREITDRDGSRQQLIRLRNPYGASPNAGMEAEWRGDWSDESSKWRTVVPQVKQDLLVKDKSDGEFWMSTADIKRLYHGLGVSK